jgi:hypothetical protein
MKTAKFIKERFDEIDANPGKETAAKSTQEIAVFAQSMQDNPHEMAIAYKTARFFMLDRQRQEWAKKDPSDR